MGYVVFLVIATVLGGGIPGFLIGVGLIAFWMWTGSMGTSNQNNQSENHSNTHQNQYQSIRKLEACIDILCQFALKYEPHWTSEKVQFVKNSFIHLCETPEDQAYLRDRLKTENRPPLFQNIRTWANSRPPQNDLEVIYAKICILAVNTCHDFETIKRDCFSAGTSFGLSFHYCDDQLKQILLEREQHHQEYEQHHQGSDHSYDHASDRSSSHSEVERAAEILGISPNATRDEIQKAYRIKIKDFHPDRNVNVTDAVKQMLEQQAHLINSARDTLMKHIAS